MAIAGWVDRTGASTNHAATWWELMSNEVITGCPDGRKYTRAQVVDANDQFSTMNDGMRRTHVAHAIGAGANLRAVAGRVGHRDLTTTIRTYQEVTQGMEDELLAVVEAIVPHRKLQDS